MQECITFGPSQSRSNELPNIVSVPSDMLMPRADSVRFAYEPVSRIGVFVAQSLTVSNVSSDFLRPSLVYQGNSKQYDRIETEVRRHVATSRTLVIIQRREISLLPRPIRLYSEIVDATERLIEALAEVRLLRFSVPRKATVFDIMPLRRELVRSRLPLTLQVLSSRSHPSRSICGHCISLSDRTPPYLNTFLPLI